MRIVALINSGDHKQKVEELSGQFEGDIVLTNAQEEAILGKKRNGLIDVTTRWVNNIVPYEITDQLNESQAASVVEGLERIEAASCIKFVVRTTETDYVEVTVSTRI